MSNFYPAVVEMHQSEDGSSFIEKHVVLSSNLKSDRT